MPALSTIIPTFVLVAIFAATVWGCGTESQSSTNHDTSQRSTTTAKSKARAQTTPSQQRQALPLTSIALDEAPSSVLDCPASVASKTRVSDELVKESSGDLSVSRVALSRAIHKREPIDPGLLFDTEDKKLFGFVEAANTGDSISSLFVTFVHESGHAAGHVELEIPANSPRWRTWAYSRNVQLPGQWTLVVEDEDGAVLDAVDFELMGTHEGL